MNVDEEKHHGKRHRSGDSKNIRPRKACDTKQTTRPTKKHRGKLKETARQLYSTFISSITSVPIDPPSGQPTDSAVPDHRLSGLFHDLLTAAVDVLDSSPHDRAGCIANHEKRFRKWIANIKPRKQKRGVSKVDYEGLDSAFMQKRFMATERLQEILNAFRSKQRPPRTKPAFDNEAIGFPCLGGLTSGRDGDSLGKMGQSVPHGKQQGNRTQEDSETGTYESCALAARGAYSKQPVTAAATAERESDMGRFYGPTAKAPRPAGEEKTFEKEKDRKAEVKRTKKEVEQEKDPKAAVTAFSALRQMTVQVGEKMDDVGAREQRPEESTEERDTGRSLSSPVTKAAFSARQIADSHSQDQADKALSNLTIGSEQVSVDDMEVENETQEGDSEEPSTCDRLDELRGTAEWSLHLLLPALVRGLI
jgi:hypothetical protein